jgi:hypothetical protein
MFQRHFIGRTLSIGACAAATLLGAAPAMGKDTKRVCTPAYGAYKSALGDEKAGHFREARESLQTCMQSTCAGLVPKCQALYDKVGSEMPSIVLGFTDESGAPRADVQVRMDGALLASRLDGKAVPVEEGMHEFSFSTDKGVLATQKVMIFDGQRNRIISVSMRSPGIAPDTTPVETNAEARKPAEVPVPEKPAPAKTADSKPSPESSSHDNAPSPGIQRTEGGGFALPRSPLPYVIAGVGLTGVAAGALLDIWGNKDNDTLVTQCYPHCNPSSVAHIKNLYVAADISFGVGAAALGVATWLFATSRAAERPAPKEAAVLDVHPIPSGAFASVSGAF